MPSYATATLYPGLCLLEATELSEGRGTTQPSIWSAGQGSSHVGCARAIDALGPPPAGAVPTYFRPQFQKHAGEVCGGVELVVTDAAAVRSFAFGVRLIALLARRWPEPFAWRKDPSEFVIDRPAIDLAMRLTRFPTTLWRWSPECGRGAGRVDRELQCGRGSVSRAAATLAVVPGATMRLPHLFAVDEEPRVSGLAPLWAAAAAAGLRLGWLELGEPDPVSARLEAAAEAGAMRAVRRETAALPPSSPCGARRCSATSCASTSPAAPAS